MTTEAQNGQTQDATSTQDAGSGANASQQQAASGASGGASEQKATVERPAHVPEALWDAASGFKIDDAVKQLTELQAFKAQIDSKNAAVPEKPDGYALKLPADLKLPDGVEFKLDETDPMFAFGRQIAHQMGADQAAFEGMVGAYAQMKAQEAAQIETLVAKQREALGPKAAERVGAINTFLSAKLGPAAADVFAGPLNTKVGVEMLEGLMRLASTQGGGTYSSVGRETAERDVSPARKMFPSMQA